MNKAKINKVVAVLTVTAAIIALASAVFSFIIPMYLSYKFRITANEAGSIGIIGGADGPTAVYIAGEAPPSVPLGVIFALLSIAGAAYLFFARRAAK